ncbi:MAG: N-acetylglucosamine-6-phosphate deacetylase [Saccharofermentanales bacterium]
MNRIVIENGKVIAPDGLKDGFTVVLKNDKIESVSKVYHPQPSDYIIDARGHYVSPGFIDTHTHGGGGYDFMDCTEEAFRGAANAHMMHGTTALVPTTLTCSDEELKLCIATFINIKSIDIGPRMLGLHLEGPYLNPEMSGAQDQRFLQIPKPEHYKMILDLAGNNLIRWSISPELEGACELGKILSECGIFPSIAHSNGYYEDALAAFENGYRTVTHLYSSLSTIRRDKGIRRLGMIESALLIDDMMVEVIADGMHLPLELLRLIYKTKGSDHMILVTDSMRAAGLETGRSILGSLKNGQEVLIEDGVAKLTDRSGLAGSTATCDRLVRVMYRQAGVPISEAVKMMTFNPAKSIGMEREIGALAAGLYADVILFDEDINISGVIIDGNVIF